MKPSKTSLRRVPKNSTFITSHKRRTTAEKIELFGWSWCVEIRRILVYKHQKIPKRTVVASRTISNLLLHWFKHAFCLILLFGTANKQTESFCCRYGCESVLCENLLFFSTTGKTIFEMYEIVFQILVFSLSRSI